MTVVLSLTVVFVLVESGLSGFTTVVLFSVLFSAGGLTVVSFCSQPANNAMKAMPVRAQMYFFIYLVDVLWLEIYGVAVGDSAGLAAGLAAGETVSVFCSHATKNAAPAKMHSNFFIECGLRAEYSC